MVVGAPGVRRRRSTTTATTAITATISSTGTMISSTPIQVTPSLSTTLSVALPPP